MGKGKGAGEDAAALQAAANMQAINEIRRQFNITSENVDPFIQAGLEALPGVQEASTVGGFGSRIAEILQGGSLDPLIDQRTQAVQGQLAAGGLTRSGQGLTDIAAIPADLAFDLENILFGRQTGLSEGGRTTALGLGSLGQQAAGTQANLFSEIGQAQASGSLLDAQTEAAALEQAGQVVGTVLPLIFSDPNLKENVEPIFEVEFNETPEKNLTIYMWDWIKEAENTIVDICPQIGFMADEVEEKYPQYVSEYCGFKQVDIDSLLKELEVINDVTLELAA